MKFNYIVLAFAFLIISNTSNAKMKLSCEPEITLKSGSYAAIKNPGGFDEPLKLKGKNEYVRRNLVNNTVTLSFESRSAGAYFRQCKYKNKRLGLKAVVRETTKVLKVIISKNFSTDSHDDDLIVYDNQLVLGSLKADKDNAEYGFVRFNNHPVLSRFNYYYSCGFTECTFKDDEYADIGNLDYLEVRF